MVNSVGVWKLAATVPHVHVPRYHHAVDGGNDPRIPQVGIGHLEGGPRLFLLCSGAFKIRLRGVQLAARYQVPRKELPVSLERPLRVAHLGIRFFEICPGLPGLRLEHLGVDLRDQLAFLDRRIEVHINVLDRSRHLRADQDGRYRINGPGSGDRGLDIAPADDLGPVFRAVALAPEGKKQDSAENRCGGDDRRLPYTAA
jgi:hypothetical protein